MTHPHAKVPSRFDRFQRRAETHASEFWAFFKPFMLGAFTVMATLIFAIGGIHFSLAEEGIGSMPSVTTQPQMENFPMMDQPPTANFQPPQTGDSMPQLFEGTPCKQGEPCSSPGTSSGGSTDGDRKPFFGQPSGQNSFNPSHEGQNRGESFQGNGEQDQKRQAQMEEENQKRQAQMEERQKKDEERRQKEMGRQFAQMKKQMAPLSSVLKRITARITSLEKQGVTAPAELKSQIEATDQALKIILSAESMDADGVQDALGSLQENGEALREAFQKLEQLAQMPRLIKQAEREIKRLDSVLSRSKKLAGRSKIDVSELVNKLQQTIDEVKAGFAKAKQLVAAGEAEEVMTILQDEVFGKMDDVYQTENMIRILQNIRANLSQFDRFVSQAKRGIAKLKKAGEDTADAQAQLDEMVHKLAEVKQRISQKISDPEELKDLVDAVFQDQEAVSDALGQPSSFVPQSSQPSGGQGSIKEFKDFSQFNFGQQQEPPHN